jgi:hypothetical protein
MRPRPLRSSRTVRAKRAGKTMMMGMMVQRMETMAWKGAGVWKTSQAFRFDRR